MNKITYSRSDFAVALFAAATRSAAEALLLARDVLFFSRLGDDGGDVTACFYAHVIM